MFLLKIWRSSTTQYNIGKMSPLLQNMTKLILKDSKVMCLLVLGPFQPSLILLI
jgi:hypothetical protein